MELKKSTKALLNLKAEIEENYTISGERFSEYEVKRGLRNKDGSGVLAGLTYVSAAIGSQLIDGDRLPIEGILKYRGIELKNIMNEFSIGSRYCFEKVAFLILVGRQSSSPAEDAFINLMSENRALPKHIIENVIKGLPGKNMMNKMQTIVSVLYNEDKDPDNLDPFENFLKAIKVSAKIPTILAYAYLQSIKPNPVFVEPPKNLSHSEAFLYMLNEGKESDQLESFIVDIALAIHTEHGGGNNSSFTTHVISSSGSDYYSAMAGAIGSLKGPLHGAANKKVMEMMSNIKENVADWKNKHEVKQYLTKIVKKEAFDKSGKIYGLGHAVYTKSDPRAEIIKQYAQKLAKKKNREDELNLYFTVAELGPEVFSLLKGGKKVISPNVDFFSGFIYDCVGLPQELYTALFAMARIIGWSAHRIEEIKSGKRIIRPGYKALN